MSDLVERLRDWGHPDWFYVDTNLLEENQSVRLEAADRIEALEFEVEHERYNVEKTAQEAAKRIKALEAALREIAGRSWHPANVRLGDIARAAIAPEQNK